jgi:hypothetical protein
MPSVSELLAREGATVDLEPGHFERLLHRRDRKRRNQRIGAGALAIIVALVSFVGLTRAFRTAERPADTPEPSRTLGALAYFVHDDLYVAAWDGTNPVRIANGRPRIGADDCGVAYWAEGPIWSPDGRYLAYRRTCQDLNDGRWKVMISDEEGNIVASFPGEGWRISWSPDSTRVAVWVHWGKTIGVYGLDGERQALLTLPPGLMAGGDFDPVWSPDGTSLLVPLGVEIPLDGSTPRQLPPDDPRTRWDETLSPDGTRVAYVDSGTLFVAAADGSDARAMTGPWVQHPVWSPTGDRVVFTYSKTIDWPYATEVRVLDVATGTVMSVAGVGSSYQVRPIAFSPDGHRILFSRTNDKGRGETSLWSVRADGSGLRRLVAGADEGDWQSLGPTP